MKILVREYDNNICTYLWKKVSNRDGIGSSSYKTEDGKKYGVVNVLKVVHDYRTAKEKYVMCSNCGKIIKESEKEDHFKEQESAVDCMKCDRLILESVSSKCSKNKLLPDGSVLAKRVCNAFCKVAYYKKVLLKDVNKGHECVYYKCRRSNCFYDIPQDMFSKYPNPYNNIITEKGVISHGWTICNNGTDRRSYSTLNGKIIANFDPNGILIDYAMNHRGCDYSFLYSDVYDKFLNVTGSEFNWNYVAERSKEKYIKAIKKLYV